MSLTILRMLGSGRILRYDRPVTLEIREAVPSERAEAGRVTAEAYREFVAPGETAWESYLDEIADVASRAGRTHVIVAVDDGRIVGSATLELDGRVDPDGDPPLAPNEAHIRMLGVHPSARGRGVARRLMSHCEERARAAGKALMTLHTTSRMQAAQAMYGSLGYRRVEDRVFPDGFVLLSYRKAL
jgi:ribosomal protein S18 acetylase RimI-like enzyme